MSLPRCASIVFLLLLLPVAVCAETSRELRLFIPDTDWPPYLVDAPDQPGKGIFIDILREAVGPLSFQVRPRKLPDKRGWLMLESGDMDVHAKARKWVERPERFLWSEPFMESETVLLFRKDSPHDFRTVEDLKGLRIAVVESFSYPLLELLFSNGNADRVGMADPFIMLKMVEEGRVDAAAVNRAGTLWLFKHRPDLHGERFRLSEPAVNSGEYRFAFTRTPQWQGFIEKLNARLDEMRSSGRLEAIKRSYQ